MELEVVQGDDVCVHDLCRVVFGDWGAVHDDRASLSILFFFGASSSPAR